MCLFAIIIDPFQCSNDCHLAWIIRDQPYLLDVISCNGKYPTCSNGTSFKDLQPHDFPNNCSYEAPIHKGVILEYLLSYLHVKYGFLYSSTSPTYRHLY